VSFGHIKRGLSISAVSASLRRIGSASPWLLLVDDSNSVVPSVTEAFARAGGKAGRYPLLRFSGAFASSESDGSCDPVCFSQQIAQTLCPIRSGHAF
jgi:hypothetical protein